MKKLSHEYCSCCFPSWHRRGAKKFLDYYNSLDKNKLKNHKVFVIEKSDEISHYNL